MPDYTWTNFDNPQSSSNVDVSNGTVSLASTFDSVDNFDDGNLDEWSGDPTYSITSSLTESGGGALHLNANKYSPALQSSSGLPNYPSRGFEFWVYIRSTGTNYQSVDTKFFTQSTDKRPAGYVVELNGSNDVFRLGLCTQGSQGVNSELDSAPTTTPANEWLRIEVIPETDGTITARLRDSSENQLAEVSANDSTYDSGGIAVEGDDLDNGIDFYWDSWMTK